MITIVKRLRLRTYEVQPHRPGLVCFVAVTFSLSFLFAMVPVDAILFPTYFATTLDYTVVLTIDKISELCALKRLTRCRDRMKCLLKAARPVRSCISLYEYTVWPQKVIYYQVIKKSNYIVLKPVSEIRRTK